MLVKKNLVQKNLSENNIVALKDFWSKKFFGPKEILVKKIVGPKKFWYKIFFPKIFLVWKKFWSKNCLVQKCFVRTNIFRFKYKISIKKPSTSTTQALSLHLRPKSCFVFFLSDFLLRRKLRKVCVCWKKGSCPINILRCSNIYLCYFHPQFCNLCNKLSSFWAAKSEHLVASKVSKYPYNTVIISV